MVNVNRVLFGGNLTKDPVLSTLPSGTAVTDFRMASHRTYTDKEGQKKEETCFIDCNAFGNNATNINKYFQKGRPIFIEGRLKLDTWETPEGQKRSKIKIVAEKFYFVDPKKNNNLTETASASIGQNNKENFDSIGEQLFLMILLKKLKLVNFCGFKNFEVDLSIEEKQEEVKKWLMMFGANGIGKSNFLNAR